MDSSHLTGLGFLDNCCCSRLFNVPIAGRDAKVPTHLLNLGRGLRLLFLWLLDVPLLRHISRADVFGDNEVFLCFDLAVELCIVLYLSILVAFLNVRRVLCLVG